MSGRQIEVEAAAGPAVQPKPSGRRGREFVVNAVLEAARGLIAERGPSDVSLREIASAAGVNNGLLYQYIGTKDSLVAEVYRRGSEETTARLAETESLDDAVEILLHALDDADYRLMIWAALNPGTSFDPEGSLDVLAASIASARRDRDDREEPAEGGAITVDDRVTAGLVAMVVVASRVFSDVTCRSAGLSGADAAQFDAAVTRLVHRIADGSAT